MATEVTATATAPVTDNDKIQCQIDGAMVHSVPKHIKDHHPDWTVERYKEEYPHAPLYSRFALEKARQLKMQKEKTERAEARGKGKVKRAFADVFDLGEVAAAKNSRGEAIMIDVLVGHDDDSLAFVPEIDPNYVFDIGLTKTILIGLQLAMPVYLWGYHGTGKTTALEQTAARTKRPFMRVQHTVNTEEAHIVGQYVVKNGATEFQLGPLPIAMINGYVYCADEYDFAVPSVLSVYQPILEGKPLVIKDAPPELRVIRPHPDFRFVATGNTNGGGDETGLYQGTQMQNAANYSRFTIVEEVQYPDPKIESAIVASQAGIKQSEAEMLVKFANEVRAAYKGGRIAMTISPRELIGAAKIGVVRGSDWRTGIRQAFTNRCSRTDKEVVEQFAQRVFG